MAIVLTTSEHDIGGLNVKRALPHMKKRMVGPFIFLDSMGPTQFSLGNGVNVKPHPHIGLSTLTYLFEGNILHRDSLGNQVEITPGDVNWMTAGKGIVHSERESLEVRGVEHSIHGLQCWVALPEDLAEIEPSFQHFKKRELPQIVYDDVMMRLIVGEAFGLTSPVKSYSSMFYIDVVAKKGSVIKKPSSKQETAIYPIYGDVIISGETFGAGNLILLEQQDAEIEFERHGRLIMLGGNKFESIPYIHWNFVSFSKERIEQAKEDWKHQRFPMIPGDDKEFVTM